MSAAMSAEMSFWHFSAQSALQAELLQHGSVMQLNQCKASFLNFNEKGLFDSVFSVSFTNLIIW